MSFIIKEKKFIATEKLEEMAIRFALALRNAPGCAFLKEIGEIRGKLNENIRTNA